MNRHEEIPLLHAKPEVPLMNGEEYEGRETTAVTEQATEETELSLLEQIAEDWQAHDKDWTRPGFRALAVHRFGNWRMKVKPKLLRAPLSMAYRMMFRRMRNLYGIELPYSAKVGRRVVIEHQGGIIIHGDVEIGDECVIRQGVTLGNKRLNEPHAAPKLGRGVNVGAGAKVLGAISIGDEAAIGANSVVLKDVACGTTVIGIPARPVNLETDDFEDLETGRGD